jgi:hypothetical protein
MSINEEFLERQILIEMKCEKIGEKVWWYMEKHLHNGKTML